MQVLNPDPKDICLHDIAHALSMLCRFNGHCLFFYSVAQHSLNVAIELKEQNRSPKIQLYGLLHDAAEAYICDLPKPLKARIPEYKKIEDSIQNSIWKKFSLPEPDDTESEIIKAIDNLLLNHEADILMRDFDTGRLKDIKTKADIRYIPMEEVEKNFLELGNKLIGLV